MASFSTPVLCQVFIGRASERDALYRLIDRTRSGQGQVALVSGEAGIGKSRLTGEGSIIQEFARLLPELAQSMPASLSLLLYRTPNRRNAASLLSLPAFSEN